MSSGNGSAIALTLPSRLFLGDQSLRCLEDFRQFRKLKFFDDV
ncbi:MAG: hypothetical protein VKJ46_04165 [Leptolyngbyaceae bacterium]|nr:hypothetical protein [Leptolyngbyaceae bacterium]